MVDRRLVISKFWSAVSADFFAAVTSDAEVLIDMRLAGAVHFHFACPGTAAHSNVFHSAAETGCLMSFEVGKRNKYVRVHNCPSDLGFFYIFSAFYRNVYLVSSLQTVCDQHMAACGKWRKAVGIGAVQMIQGVFTAAYIKRVAVSQERSAAQFLYYVCNCLGLVGT